MFIINKKTYEVVDFYEGQIADAFDMYLLLVSLSDKLKEVDKNNLAE
jgi:hypothetical protein